MWKYSRHSFSYRSTALVAHALADLLKRACPKVQVAIEQLQGIVMRSHAHLEEAKYSHEVAAI